MDKPVFDADFQKKLEELFLWRRDVRRFKPDPLDSIKVEKLLKTATLAPSVGNSQPWRFVMIESPDKRKAIRDIFEKCNAEALNDYHGEKAKLYASLKLQGLDMAPVHLAVYADTRTVTGYGLGQKTMPETLHYSVVGAIQTLWLTARAQGIGLGWVSIIDPVEVSAILDVPEHWSMVGYLCIGYPEEEHLDPELVRHGWQDRLDFSSFLLKR